MLATRFVLVILIPLVRDVYTIDPIRHLVQHYPTNGQSEVILGIASATYNLLPWPDSAYVPIIDHSRSSPCTLYITQVISLPGPRPTGAYGTLCRIEDSA